MGARRCYRRANDRTARFAGSVSLRKIWPRSSMHISMLLSHRLACLIFLLFSFGNTLHAQVTDSLLRPDTIPIPPLAFPMVDTTHSPAPDTLTIPRKKKRFIKRFFEDYPNPNKALYMALVIPAGGQMYNKRWWKVPLAYGTYAAFIVAIDRNTSKYRLYRDAYIAELKGEKHPFTDTSLDAGDLRALRDGYDKNKQLSYIGLVATHIVVTAEAFVDAHLRTFDISDDLSLRVYPNSTIVPGGDTFTGMAIALQFR